MTWQLQAACAGVGPSLWFADDSTDHSTIAQARTVCYGCPVRLECLEWALSEGEIRHGVWGGLTPKERQRELTKRHGTLRGLFDAPLEHGGPWTYAACQRRNGEPCEKCRLSRNVAVAERRAVFGRPDRPRSVAS